MNPQTKRRARQLMEYVKDEGDHFSVTFPTLGGKSTSVKVGNEENNSVYCTCTTFTRSKSKAHCEHILAVLYYIESKAEEDIDTSFLEEMKKTMPLKETKPKKAASKKKEEVVEPEETEELFHWLHELRKTLDPKLIKKREGWKDRNGRPVMVEYVEWHTVADVLDEVLGNAWSFSIHQLNQQGSIVWCLARITVRMDDGVEVYREGIGTGKTDTEVGIKKAEHDALKRAAVKFGVARNLYRAESEREEYEGSADHQPAKTPSAPAPAPKQPAQPKSANVGQPPSSGGATEAQLNAIVRTCERLGIDAEEECQAQYSMAVHQLNKSEAGAFITYLNK